MGWFGEKKYGDGRDAPKTPPKPPVPYDSVAKRQQETLNKSNKDGTDSAIESWKNYGK